MAPTGNGRPLWVEKPKQLKLVGSDLKFTRDYDSSRSAWV